jgi:hypothetical protein
MIRSAEEFEAGIHDYFVQKEIENIELQREHGLMTIENVEGSLNTYLKNFFEVHSLLLWKLHFAECRGRGADWTKVATDWRYPGDVLQSLKKKYKINGPTFVYADTHN